MLQLENFFSQTTPLINQTLETLLPQKGEKLVEAALYSLEGGKRLRPLLTLAVVATFEEPLEKALYPASALEMIHTYSLIHDDLPCMDNDDLRRGKPTLHKAFSESHAVLTGDFLLTYAFEVLAKAPYLEEGEKNSLIAILARRCGREGMIGGQISDIEFQDNFPDLPTLIQNHTKKTGALITAALEFGAILTHQPLPPLQKIGEYFGLAYQIVDDILDHNGAATLLGMDKAKKMAQELYEKVLVEIQSLSHPAPLLEALASLLIFRTV